MKNVLVVFNYDAGRKQAVLYKQKLHKFLLRRCNKFKFITIDEFKTAEIDEYDTIFVVGGDGTVNAVAKTIADTDKTLAIIPSGTANLLSAKLGMSENLEKTFEIIDSNNTTKIDLLDINGNLCCLRLGLGYDSDIICKTPQSLKNKFGYFAYFIAGIIFALRLTPKKYEICYDGNRLITDATCVIIGNSPNMFRNIISVAKKSSLTDGIFEIFILKAKNPFSFFYEFMRILLGIKTNNNRTLYLKAKSLEIKNNWTSCHIDGEKTKLKGDIEVSARAKVLKVYAKSQNLVKETSI